MNGPKRGKPQWFGKKAKLEESYLENSKNILDLFLPKRLKQKFALDNELATIYTPDPIDLSNQTTGFTLSEEVQERIRQQGGISYTQPTTPTTPSTPSSTTPPSTPSYGGGGGY